LAVETRDWVRPSWAGGHGIIHLGLCDSSVTIGAIGKGRSSSYKINGILRGMLGPCLVTGNSWALNFIGTKWNPGDYPSRRKPLPEYYRLADQTVPTLEPNMHRICAATCTHRPSVLPVSATSSNNGLSVQAERCPAAKSLQIIVYMSTMPTNCMSYRGPRVRLFVHVCNQLPILTAVLTMMPLLYSPPGS